MSANVAHMYALNLNLQKKKKKIVLSERHILFASISAKNGPGNFITITDKIV